MMIYLTKMITKNDYKYWNNDTSLVWIDLVKEITPEHLEIIQRYL